MDNVIKTNYLNKKEEITELSKRSGFFVTIDDQDEFRRLIDADYLYPNEAPLLYFSSDPFRIKRYVDDFILDLVSYLSECSFKEAMDALRDLDDLNFKIIIDEHKDASFVNKIEKAYQVGFKDYISFFDLLTFGGQDDVVWFDNVQKLETAINLIAFYYKKPEFAYIFGNIAYNLTETFDGLKLISSRSENGLKQFSDFVYSLLKLYSESYLSDDNKVEDRNSDAFSVLIEYIDVSDATKFKEFMNEYIDLEGSGVGYIICKNLKNLPKELMEYIFDVLVNKLSENTPIYEIDEGITFKKLIIMLDQILNNKKHDEEVKKAYIDLIVSFNDINSFFDYINRYLNDDLDDKLKELKTFLVNNNGEKAVDSRMLIDIIDYLLTNGENLTLLLNSYITFMIDSPDIFDREFLLTMIVLSFRPLLEGNAKETFDEEFNKLGSFTKLYNVLDNHVKYDIDERYALDMFKVNLKFVTRILLYFFEQHKIYYYGLCLNIITILNKTTNLVFGDIVEDQLMVEFYKAFKHTSFAKLIEDYKDIKYNLKLKLIGNYKNA